MLGWALAPRAFEAHFDPRSDHLRFYTRRTLTGCSRTSAFKTSSARAPAGCPARGGAAGERATVALLTPAGERTVALTLLGERTTVTCLTFADDRIVSRSAWM